MRKSQCQEQWAASRRSWPPADVNHEDEGRAQPKCDHKLSAPAFEQANKHQQDASVGVLDGTRVLTALDTTAIKIAKATAELSVIKSFVSHSLRVPSPFSDTIPKTPWRLARDCFPNTFQIMPFE